VGFNSLKSLNLTNVYPNNNKVKSKPLELYELSQSAVIVMIMILSLLSIVTNEDTFMLWAVS
jgi:hypothetical protein